MMVLLGRAMSATFGVRAGRARLAVQEMRPSGRARRLGLAVFGVGEVEARRRRLAMPAEVWRGVLGGGADDDQVVFQREVGRWR